MLARNGVGRGELGTQERGALAANPHRQTVAFGCAGEHGIHVAGCRVAAGHARDHQRGTQATPQELDRQVDRAVIELRQRLVHQMDVVPASAVRRLDVPCGRQPQVIGLARLDQVIHATERYAIEQVGSGSL